MKKPFLLLAAVVSILGFADQAKAQYKAPALLEVVTLHAKSGSTQALEDYMTKLVDAANKAGIPQSWLTAQVTLGGAGRTYVVILPVESWGAMDSFVQIPEFLSKAYGPQEAAKIQASGGQAIEKFDTAVYRLLPGLSTSPEKIDLAAPYFQMIRTEVRSGMGPEYEIFLARVKEAQEKMGAGGAVRRVTAVGSLSTYLTSRSLSKLADLDAAGPGEALRKAFGDSGAEATLAIDRRAVAHREVWVLAARPDLSRQPAAPTSN